MNFVKAIILTFCLALFSGCASQSILRRDVNHSYHRVSTLLATSKSYQAKVHNQVANFDYRGTSKNSLSDAKKKAMIACKSAQVGHSVKNACVTVPTEGK